MLEDGMTLYLGSPYKLDKTVVANGVPVEGVEVTFVTEGDVFSVDQEGNVTALKEGEQTLKATATVNGVTILEGTYTVKIREYLSVKTGIAQNDLRLKLTNYYEDSLTEFALSQCQAVVGSETCDVEITYAVEDTAVAMLEFKNGALGVIEASTCAYPGFERRLEIHGDKGYVVLVENRIAKLMIDGKEEAVADFDVSNTSSDPAALRSAMHQLQIENLICAMKGEERLLIDGKESKRAVRVIEEIYRSSKREDMR
jgi:hypothetical protein